MKLPKYLDPARYAARFRHHVATKTYNLPEIQEEELKKFSEAGLDVAAGRERLDEILLDISGRKFDHIDGTDSVHWLLFSCLSLTDWGRNVRNILEIGTFRGKTTSILKQLFPNAEVVTCDLPEDDPILQSSYRRGDAAALEEYKTVRDSRVCVPGIKFVEQNSFFLPAAAPGPYDLIWMDGGHLYPEVAWDMCNAWHMCKPGGIIMCDDVFTHPNAGDGVYGNLDSHSVIEYLRVRVAADIRYFLKRENPQWSADEKNRKFVARIVKPAEHSQGNTT